MRKFPELIATKQDVENIINNHPEHHAQLKVALLRTSNELDKATQVISHDTDEETGEMINIVEKHITRPNQMWERMGYKNKGELDSALAKL